MSLEHAEERLQVRPEAHAAVDEDPRLSDLLRMTSELLAAEADVAGWREQRNREIHRLRTEIDDPPTIETIATVAGVRHGFVSRIVKGGGVPASGRDAGGGRP